ncbi:unnamed protein product, partial [Rotaria socialis]
MQQLSGNKSEQSTAPTSKSEETKTTPSSTPTTVANVPPTNKSTIVPTSKKPTIVSATMTKKDAAKKATMEIHRKKQGLLEEQIQQQKTLLKKLETAETHAEKESILALMKQINSTIIKIKDSLSITPPIKASSTTVPAKSTTAPPATKISQQDVLKQRAQILQKQLESLRAKTSADM